MEEQALRMSADVEYRNALGQATWAFIELEWNAVNIADLIEPGFVRRAQKMTSGVIAYNLVRLVATLDESSDKKRLLKEARIFKRLVATRNDMMHAGPADDPPHQGHSMLSRTHTFPTSGSLEKAADDFFDCGVALNSHLHGFLRRLRNS
jgi:hypothetical protein